MKTAYKTFATTFAIVIFLAAAISAGFVAGARWNEAEYRTMRVTAYCPCEKCCGKYADGITASGHVIQAGDRFCAASKDYPFGTMITIPGYGKAEVRDRGGAIKENRLDVYFDTHQEALNWGVKNLTVKVRR